MTRSSVARWRLALAVLPLLLALVTFCITLPAAWVLHVLVERPMQQLGRVIAARLARRQSPLRRIA